MKNDSSSIISTTTTMNLVRSSCQERRKKEMFSFQFALMIIKMSHFSLFYSFVYQFDRCHSFLIVTIEKEKNSFFLLIFVNMNELTIRSLFKFSRKKQIIERTHLNSSTSTRFPIRSILC